MKQNKKLILIAMIAFAVIAAAIMVAICLFPKTLDFSFAPFTSQYESRKNYDSQDPNIVFDGVLDDAIWQNVRWLEVDHVSEEFIGVKMTTYFGEDGLYMAFDVDDYGVYYDKYRYIDYNSGLQLYLSPVSGAKDITNCGYEISLNAGEMVGLKQFDGTRFEDYLGRVYMESQIKGEMNSAKATGYTIEAYIDYALLGKNCKEVFAYPAIIHTTSATESERQWYSFGLNEKGVSWTQADTWWSFDKKGLMGHEVNFQAIENGTVEGESFVPNGDDYTFTLAPDSGFYAESVKVNGKDVMSQLYYYQGKTLCTVERVEEKLDIQVAYAATPEETMEISAIATDVEGNALNAQIWAVACGYSQMLTADAQGNFTASVPAIPNLELFASAEGYVSKELVAKAGQNNISLVKMYFGNNEQVVRSCTNMALWDLTRMYQNRVRMISSEYSQQLVRSDIYSKNIYASAKLFTDVEKGADTRAGFTFYVNEELSVYVALTMHGEVNEYNPNGNLNCSVQIITEKNGERIWGNGGAIVPIENPERIMKLATTEGVPFAVHYNKGAFDVWVDNQQIGYGIYPKDENGRNRLKANDSVAVGLETWSSRAIFEELKLDGNYPAPRMLSASGWDLSRINSGVATSKSAAGTVAMLNEDYRNQLCVSANLPLQLQACDDIRAGVVLRNTQGTEVFVALTAHGQSHYSLQVISGGWVSWNVRGKIEDISAWEELKSLAKTDGIPMTVYAKNGKLTIGLNGYLVGEDITPLDRNGQPIWGGNSDVAPGLATPGATLTITGITVGTTKPALKNPVERLWDISKADEGIYTSLTDDAWASLWLTDSYDSKTAVSAKLPLKLQAGDDIRAGVVLRNELDVEVFVALTVHGLSHYSVQVISGGWASWHYDGQIEDLSTWTELTELNGIPLTVYAENGKLTLGINGYLIGKDIVPLDAEGKPILGNATKLKPGLATSGTSLTFTEVTVDENRPELKNPITRIWDISKANDGTYTSLTDDPWNSLWLHDTYTNNVAVSAKLPLKLQAGDDIRAGFVLRNQQGTEVFVALTAHGLSHYSVQVISGGWASWAVTGHISDISGWDELAALAQGDGIPMSVSLKNGKLTIGINGYLVADSIIPLNAEGNPIWGNDTALKPGLVTSGTMLAFTDVALDATKLEEDKPTEPGKNEPTEPELQDPIERFWDISKASEGIYTSLTKEPWASLWLSDTYTEKASVFAKIPLKLSEGEDVRAGVVLRNEQGIEVFVALTAHGMSHYSVQVISGGWASWAVEGQIEDLSTWAELAALNSIPLSVYIENGKLTLGINGYVIAKDIVPMNADGQPVLTVDTKIKAGLATAGVSLTFTDVAEGSEKPVLKNPVERLWDISKANEGIYTSLTDESWANLWLSDNYTDKVTVSAKLPLKLAEGDDIRAGVVLRNEQGIEVFVALTAHGLSHYSVQVISGGWASWAVEGQIEDLSTWAELAALDSIPLSVYIENGKLTLGINSYVIAKDIVPMNADGQPVLTVDTKIKAGLATAGVSLTFTDVAEGSEKPVLKNPVERLWDISKANEGIYTSLTDEAWANLWLSDNYTDKVTVSAKLPLKLAEGDDIRAGVVLRNEQGVEVFVALTAHGLSHYSVQVISGGWASWAVEGQISDLSTWNELTSLDSIPLTVYIENGKLTLGINGYVIAENIVPLNAAGNPTFGSNAKIKPGLATAGTALTFTKVTTGTEKPALKQKLRAEKGGTIVIPGDFTAAKYAVLELNIKALDAITYDWNSNILISPTGAVWDAYDFQILFGGSSQQNLIKLTGAGASADGLSVSQEQWVNDPKLENLFSEQGIGVKLVRMDTWAYLLVDMGSGYTIVGKMIIPTSEATSFSLWNHSTAIEVTDYNVMTGQAAALEAINGLDLTLSASGMAFPVSGDSWTLEGRLVIDTATFPWGTGEYRMYAGADSWGQAVSVYYNRANWYLQNHTNWANTQLTNEQCWKLSAESGGMWVRFQKIGNVLTVSVSADGENWTSTLNHTGATAKGIYLIATIASQLRDVKLTAGT